MNYDENYVKELLPKRKENSHKGTFGHVLNIAGSKYYTGAAYFSSISALKVGCGLVTLASEDRTLQAIASLTPNIILQPVEKINAEYLSQFQAISIGCGLSQGADAVKTFKKVMKLLKSSSTPTVIDADGLNILATLRPFREKVPEGRMRGNNLPQNTILTPHPKEMSRLLNVSVKEILEQPDFFAKKCANDYGCTVILKLHKTIVVDNNGHFYQNNTGNSALSHGGSGDVLCGMISGFLAQGLNLFDAACLGVHLHGKAAEIGSEEYTEYSLLASDLINFIPQAIKTIND